MNNQKLNQKLGNFILEEDEVVEPNNLKKISDLNFLQEENIVLDKKDREFWSLYGEGNFLEPLKFTNGKTQEDVVKEVVELVRNGKKIIFIQGVCGTGKSAIALNIARVLGRASVVVPVKALQRQYEEDYSSKKYLSNKGKRMRIAMITGRENHDSVIKPGSSCADPLLPDNIKISEKNLYKLKEYYEKNPFITNKHKVLPDIRLLKRISVAPANPYWSPILSSDIELNQLKDATKKRYDGLLGEKFIFYHRKRGCSYYDQYQSYLDADVIIFNSMKYKIEVELNRKPLTDVEIIDEADEFLDSFSTQESLNLSRLDNSLKMLFPENSETQKIIDKILELIEIEEKRIRAIGLNEKNIFKLNETKIGEILKLLLSSLELESEIVIDDINYANEALSTAKSFVDFFEDTYLTYKKFEEELYVNLVTTELSKKFQEIVNKNRALVLMSGTLHSDNVLKNIFGIEDYSLVEAESYQQGAIEIIKTGKEFDCKYANFSSGKYNREQYLKAFSFVIQKAVKPFLVHVNAFEDLPNEEEIFRLELGKIMTSEKLRKIQQEDKTGRAVALFKSKLSDELFSTRCSRGVDFPGDTCNSIIFTKYPNPNVQGTFWKVLQKTHPDFYWEFYNDKAWREFLQRIFRALRFKGDHVYILSPDIRVLEGVRELQEGNYIY